MDTITKRTIKELESIVGTLSNPSKMPGRGYSIPARRCQIGSIMREVPGSTCERCYAMKGRYVFANVQAALEFRFRSLTDPRWVDAMVELISRKEGSGFFRWHDSGDLQGVWHLEMIVAVARELPGIRFWLPTREFRMVAEFVKGGGIIPSNLTVRLSGLMLDEMPPALLMAGTGTVASTVSTTGTDVTCPAQGQGNACGACRACWDRDTAVVTYPAH
jgi:hypothetical protein